MKNRMITKMKQVFKTAVLPLLMLSILVSACSKNNDANPQVTIGFAQEQYGIPYGGEVIVKVQASRNVDQDMTVPFSITGSLDKADYTVAGESVVIKQGTKEAELKVTISKELSEDDFLQIELGSVGGNTVLAKSKTRLSVTPGDVIIYSFDKENYEMSESVLVTLDLKTSTGSFIAEE